MNGTSMAAPVVSGTAALLLQQHPDLTPDQLKARLMKTASKSFPASSIATDSVTGETFTSYYDIFTVGAGYLDIGAALNNNELAVGTAPSPVAVLNSATGSGQNRQRRSARVGRSACLGRLSSPGAISSPGATSLPGATQLAWGDQLPGATRSIFGDERVRRTAAARLDSADDVRWRSRRRRLQRDLEDRDHVAASSSPARKAPSIKGEK